MSKTKRRKKARSRASGANVAVQERVEREAPIRRASFTRRPSLQNAVFALLITLGFLGFAGFFTFFYSEDANHFIYGAVMGLTALGWLAITVRRWSLYRQSVQV
jgi:hypothetical protein